MTTTSSETLIEQAAERTSMTVLQVKNWIGNERKRQGLARKRGPRPKKEGTTVPCKLRKTSGYQLFKSYFLKSTLATTLRRSFSDAEVQRRANAVWRNLGVGEKEKWLKSAEELNTNPPQKEETKLVRARKLIAHIRTCIDQLDDFGYPSLWLGVIDNKPERHLSKNIGELADDQTFTTYAVSAMLKITAKEKMENNLPLASRKKEKKTKKTVRAKTNSKASNGTSAGTNPAVQPNHATFKKDGPDIQNSASSQFRLLGQKGKSAVFEGEKVKEATVVHGRTLKPGWASFMVKKILASNVKPWDDYPTLSGW